MNNFEHNLGKSAAPEGTRRAHRGLKTSHAEFLRLWNDNSLTTEEIGRRLQITQSNVCKRAKARGLPPRGPNARFAITDTDQFREMWEAGVTIEDMARHFGVFSTTIKRARIRFGLAPRGKGDWRRAITLEQFLHDRLARQMARTAMQETLMLLDAGVIDRTHGFHAFMRDRRGAAL